MRNSLSAWGQPAQVWRSVRIIAGVVAAYGLAGPSAAQSSWTLRDSAAEDALNAVVHDGTRFVAVGEAGALATSVDGTLWTAAPPGTIGGSMRGLLHTGTHFVACGQSDFLFGTILTSADAVTWTPATVASSSGAILTGLATNGTGLYVVCGSGGRLYQTRNPATWPAYASLPGTPLLQAVAYGGGWFVTVGEGGTLARSRHGVDWTVLPTGTAEFLSGITYGNGRWVAVGSGGTILASTDLATWTPRSTVTTKYLFSVSYEAGQYIATGADGTILTSPDGLAWTVRPTSLNAERLAGVVEGGDQLVAVGELAFETGKAAAITAVAERPPGFRWGAATAVALEADGAFTLTLSRTGSASGAAEVQYFVLSGTAVVGVDLPDSSPVITFADGETSRTISIPLTTDQEFEGEETFLVELRTITPGWAALRPATVSVSLRDAQDSDNDGLFDAWEQLHFLGLGETGAADPDGDGNSNLVEYTDGSVPTDVNSALYFLNLASTGQGTLASQPPAAKHPRGSEVSVVAAPADGWVVRAWSGSGTGTGLTRSVTMTGDLNLSADFILSLGGALDAPAPGWVATGPGQPWFGQTLVSHDTVDAAQSGPVPASSSTTLTAALVGPATVSFWWRASCRANSDFLRVLVDGEEKAFRTGAADWELATLDIPAGDHTLAWTYARGPQGPIGQDAGWVDQVTITTSGYAAWLVTAFSPQDLAQPAISGPTADPDLDGVPNLAEFAFGTPPQSFSATHPGLPKVEIAGTASGPRRSLVFTRSLVRAGQVIYQGNWSADLKTWTTYGTEEILSTVDGIQTVRIVDPQAPAEAPRRLYRVQVTSITR